MIENVYSLARNDSGRVRVLRPLQGYQNYCIQFLAGNLKFARFEFRQNGVSPPVHLTSC